MAPVGIKALSQQHEEIHRFCPYRKIANVRTSNRTYFSAQARAERCNLKDSYSAVHSQFLHRVPNFPGSKQLMRKNALEEESRCAPVSGGVVVMCLKPHPKNRRWPGVRGNDFRATITQSELPKRICSRK